MNDDSPAAPPLTLPPAPRAVNGGPGLGWLSRLFILPHALVGLGLAVFVVLLMLWSLFGTNMQGAITGKSTSRSKGTTYYHLQYTFRVDGQAHDDSAQVPFAEYQRASPGDARTVRYFAAGPLHYSSTPDPRSVPPWLPALFFALFWNGFMCVFYYQMFFLPLLERWLCRNGTAVRGVVVRKDEKRGARNRRMNRLRYAFVDEWGTRREREVTAPSSEWWARIQVEDPITVLVVPGRPRWNVAYEVASYRIVGLE